jgi:ATP-dependent Clp protease adaptor protein ClpS
MALDRDSDIIIGSDVQQDEEEELKEPEMYTVVMYNDHYTTMEFVVGVLRSIFHKPIIEATKIMMDVHKKGKAIVGLYTYDVAATKVAQVRQKAREHEYPLKCTVERP